MERVQKLAAQLRAPTAQRGASLAENETSAAARTAEVEKDVVKYEVLDGHVALITLNRPTRLNALTNEMQAVYFDQLDRAEADPNIRVIVVTGAGRGFCAGAEMELLKSIGSVGAEVAAKPRRELSQIQSLALTKPVIGAINGPCAGLGFVLAMMTDVRFTIKGAKFTSAFAKRGLVAEHGVSWILPRVTGLSNAMDILLSSRVFLGDEAERLGVVSRAYPDVETLLSETIAYARAMARDCSPASLAEIKAQVYADYSATPRAAYDEAFSLMLKSFSHPDSKEGVSHYVDKREARWQGLAAGRIKDTAK